MAEVVALTSPARRVLAALALLGPTDRLEVARLLFDGPDRRRLARLRDVLFRMPARGALVRTSRPGVLGLATPILIDVHGLRRDLAHLRDGRPQALARLPWSTELLPGWDDWWVLEERVWLHRRVIEALLGHCAASLDRPGPDGARAAVVAAERALHLAPLDEDVARWVIRAHLAVGDPATALRCLTALTDRLHRELQVGPQPATLALVVGLAPRAGADVSRGR